MPPLFFTIPVPNYLPAASSSSPSRWNAESDDLLSLPSPPREGGRDTELLPASIEMPVRCQAKGRIPGRTPVSKPA